MRDRRKTIYTKKIYDNGRYTSKGKLSPVEFSIFKYVPRPNTKYINFGRDKYSYNFREGGWEVITYHVFNFGKATLSQNEFIISKEEALRTIALEGVL